MVQMVAVTSGRNLETQELDGMLADLKAQRSTRLILVVIHLS